MDRNNSDPIAFSEDNSNGFKSFFGYIYFKDILITHYKLTLLLPLANRTVWGNISLKSATKWHYFSFFVLLVIFHSLIHPFEKLLMKLVSFWSILFFRVVSSKFFFNDLNLRQNLNHPIKSQRLWYCRVTVILDKHMGAQASKGMWGNGTSSMNI